MIFCSASTCPSRVSTFSNTGGSTGFSTFLTDFALGFFSPATASFALPLPLDAPLTATGSLPFPLPLPSVFVLVTPSAFTEPACFAVLGLAGFAAFVTVEPLTFFESPSAGGVREESESKSSENTCDGRCFFFGSCGCGPLTVPFTDVGSGVRDDSPDPATSSFFFSFFVFLAAGLAFTDSAALVTALLVDFRAAFASLPDLVRIFVGLAFLGFATLADLSPSRVDAFTGVTLVEAWGNRFEKACGALGVGGLVVLSRVSVFSPFCFAVPFDLNPSWRLDSPTWTFDTALISDSRFSDISKLWVLALTVVAGGFACPSTVRACPNVWTRTIVLLVL